jgi:ferredoxin-nitrate reductase
MACDEQELRSICPYCGVGCGLVVGTAAGRVTLVKGDPLYPVNRGRTCRKPLALPAAVHAADRASEPLHRPRRDGPWRATTWDDAIGAIAGRLREIASQHGPDALGFYISGQLLTEDYYVVNKLVKGFLGTNNLDSNSRLCMSSAVAGYAGAFGSDGPPGAYADIEASDCLLLLGTNTAACHPIVWSRIRDRAREGAFLICIDPRPTQTARASDLHLPVRPGTDLPLLNAMLAVIADEGLLDETFVEHHTGGLEETLATAREWTPERAAAVCGVDPARIVEAANRFGTAQAAMALWSMGANQSRVGTLKNRALINLCLATGNIGRPGAGPFSLTGQPNAMGGRETGGLAHLLPGYRRVDDAAHRAEIEALWQTPGTISERPGHDAVSMFEAAAAGQVKALWIAATNPVVSVPDSALVRAALERAELVVVQDAHHPTETSTRADYVLPAAAWPEKQGTMTNSERRVGLVRRALDPPGEALPDWRIFARMAGALGHAEHFAWADEAAVFDEFARTTAGRPCDLSGFSHARLEREGGIQWASERLYEQRRFPTPDGRARFAATPHADPAELPDEQYPLQLTTGRVADQWHTMTRTGKSAALKASAGEPELELSPEDAREAGVADGELALVRSRRGQLRLRVRVVPKLTRGVAFAPFHWGPLHAAPGAGALNAATLRDRDPVSRQPELKALAVAVEPVAPAKPTPVPARPRATQPRHLLVVGTGMSGLAVAEEAVRRRVPDELSVTMLGEEPSWPYNRILVSKLLAGTCGAGELELRPRGWFGAHAIDLRFGRAAVALDLDAQLVTDDAGECHGYDALVLATGSRPFTPPIPGADLPHVHVFRTIADANRLARTAEPAGEVVVLGGGLLGLEAAAGLAGRGARVTVIERAGRLMPQQLDGGAAAILERQLNAKGISVLAGRSVTEIATDAVTLDDGQVLRAPLVVMAAGVVPEVSLARAAGIECARGIVVDDAMRTSAPHVWATGECAEHRGTVYGLWAPLADQARVAAADLVGDPAGFHGAVAATTLKVAGVELFAGGRAEARPAEDDEILSADTRRGRYRRLLLDGDRLAGAILLGDTSQAPRLSALLRSGERVPDDLLEPAGPATDQPPDPAAVVCSCNSVTGGQIEDAIVRGGLSTVAQIGNATRAGTGCGGCVRELEGLLGAHRPRSSGRNIGETTGKSTHGSITA